MILFRTSFIFCTLTVNVCADRNHYWWGFRYECKLGPEVLLGVDEDGRYFLPKNTSAITTSDERVNSTEKEEKQEFHDDIAFEQPAINFVRVRECPCAREIHDHDDVEYSAVAESYCASDSARYCYVKYRSSSSPPLSIQCYEHTQEELSNFFGFLYPVTLVWVAGVCLLLCCSSKGLSALRYSTLLFLAPFKMCLLPQSLVNAYDSWPFEGLLTREVERVYQLENAQDERIALDRLHTHISRFHRVSRNVLEKKAGDKGYELLQLVLKTVYFDEAQAKSKCKEQTTKSESDEDYGDEIICTICLGDLKDGEKLGDLPCKHLFHTSCLKGWIKRNNVCPLCFTSDIAHLRRGSKAKKKVVFSSKEENDEYV